MATLNKRSATLSTAALFISAALIMGTALSGCSQQENDWPDATQIALSDEQITVNGETIAATEDSTAKSDNAAVYVSHDIVYYEDREAYDSGNAYGEGTEADRHSAEEASAHTVVNITQPGTYHISGKLSRGQLAVDLGDGAKRDPEAVVTLILDGADITCTVAPAVIFYQVYECNEDWVSYDEGEIETYNAVAEVDTSAAGANVIIADGSVNNIDGSYVARIYKDNGEEKKLHKYDGAFYSKMTMNVDGGEKGDGVLNITASNEGLDSEMHLTINGGKINIAAQNDGINTNEDGVSATTINGGSLHIVAGLGEEGDGIDSNGYLTINGGTVIAIANPRSDSGLDSDLGSYIHGGTVLAVGSTMDWAESDSRQVTMNLQFSLIQDADEAIVVTDQEGVVLFAYDPDQDETTGAQNRGYQGAVISSPNFAVDETYFVYIGGDVQGSDVDGLFDVDTVTGFDGGVKQEYTSTDVRMGRPGGGSPDSVMGAPRHDGEEGKRGDFQPDGENDAPPQMPNGEDGLRDGFRPDGENGAPPQMPHGEDGPRDGSQPNGENGAPPQMSDGQKPPRKDDQKPGEMPPNGAQSSEVQSGEALPGNFGKPSTEFYMADKVNAFGGVCDEGTNVQ